MPRLVNIKLDTRERRCDLTSRECASILGAFFGGMVRAHGLAHMREAVRVLATLSRGLREAASGKSTDIKVEATGTMVHIMRITAAVYYGLNENAAPGAALDAMSWWAEHDDAWAQLGTGTDPAAKDIPS